MANSGAAIKSTRNYRLFVRSEDNRAPDLKAHRALERSMKKHGFLRCFPIVVRRFGSVWQVLDGQHRLAFAETLKLPVHYVVAETEFDIAQINSTPKTWKPRDYAEKYAALGNENYRWALEFCDEYGLNISIGFALLADSSGYGNIRQAFIDGRYEIKALDAIVTELLGSTFQKIVSLSRDVYRHTFAIALRACFLIPEFDPERLIKCAERCREKLVAYSTIDANLGMLEEIYNFGRQHKLPLKFQAQELRASNQSNRTKS